MMLRSDKNETLPSARGLRFGIAAAQYNSDLADALVANCVDLLVRAEADTRHIKVLRVPGSFEISAAAAKLAKSQRYHCIIGLGVLLQGQTKHADFIGAAVAYGLTKIAIEMDVPTVFGIVTADTLKQAQVRCIGRQYNRGREAALTAIQMARHWRDL